MSVSFTLYVFSNYVFFCFFFQVSYKLFSACLRLDQDTDWNAALLVFTNHINHELVILPKFRKIPWYQVLVFKLPLEILTRKLILHGLNYGRDINKNTFSFLRFHILQRIAISYFVPLTDIDFFHRIANVSSLRVLNCDIGQANICTSEVCLHTCLFVLCIVFFAQF